jgi:hypothetical protein
MITDSYFYLLAVPALVLSGLAKGGFLASIGVVAVPILSLVIPPVQAAAIMLPILIAMDWVGVAAYRREWSEVNLRILLPAATVGIIVGWALARFIPESFVRLMVGLIGLSFTLNHWFSPGAMRAAAGPSRMKGSFWGALAGFTSFVSHAGGPPLAVYLLPQRLSNAAYAGTAVMFFTAVNLLKVPPYFLLGQFNRANVLTSLALLPLAIASMWLGIRLVRTVPQEPFYRIAYLGLFAISLKLISDGIRAFLS